MSTEGVFSMSARFLKVQENQGHVEVEVRREEGDAPAKVEFRLEDVSAVSGRDYKAPPSCILDFDFGEKAKTIDIEIMDNPIKHDDKIFKVVLKKATGGKLKSPTLALRDPLSTKIKVIDDENHMSERIFNSRGFQFLSVLYTTYALFGTDTALIVAPATADDVIGYITISCVAFFIFEIMLTVAVQGWKYFNTVMFYMDLIAMAALVPSIPAVAELMSGAMGGVSSTGTIARAGRAARAGSRAGRTIKLPKLIGKVVEVSLTVALYLGVTTEDDEDGEDDEVAAGSDDKKGKNDAARGEKKKRKKDKANSKEQMKRNNKSPKNPKEDVQKRTDLPSESELSPSKVGARLMELFTGKVIVMMMLMLVTSTLLEIAMEPFQKELGVQTLDAVYQSVDGDLEHPSFRNALSVFIRGGKPGSKYNPNEELLYLKVGGEIVPRLDTDPEADDDLTIVPSYMVDAMGNYAAYYNDEDEYERLREVELQFAGGCNVALNKAVNAHTSSSCKLAAIFDNAANVHAAAAANMYLTVLIVIILGLGMGLIASDMQKIVLDPIDRISSFVKMFLPKKEDDNGEDDDNAEEEQERNVVTEIKENFQHIVKGLISLTEAIPRDQPLKLIFEAISDVEAAFSVKYTSLRRTLLKLEAPIKTMLAEMKRSESAYVRGQLTRNRLNDSMNLVTQQILEVLAGIPQDVLQEHPNVIRAIKLTQQSLPALVKFINSTLAVLENGIVTMAIFAQAPLEGTELTNEQVSDLLLMLVRGISRRALILCGKYDLARQVDNSSIEEMFNILNNHIKKETVAMCRKLGLEPDRLNWEHMKLADIKASMNEQIIAKVLSLLPERMVSQIPESLRQAHTAGLHRFQEELQMFVVNQGLESLSHFRRTPSHSLVTDQMVERIQEATLAYRSGRVGVADSLNRVSSLVQEICVHHMAVGFPILDEVRKMKHFLEEMQLAHTSESYQLFLEKMDYNPQMFASLLGSVPLPTREQMLSDPKRYVEELRATVHRAHLPELVDKQLKKSLHAAVEEMRGLMNLIPRLPTSAAAATALGEDEVRKLLHKLMRYRHLVPATMTAGFSWPAADSLDTLPVARMQQLLADILPALRTVEARFGQLPIDMLQMDAIFSKLSLFRRQLVNVDLVEQNIGLPLRKMALAASRNMGLGYTEEALQALGLQDMMWNILKDLGKKILGQVQDTSSSAVQGMGRPAMMAQELGVQAVWSAEEQVAVYAQEAKDHARMLAVDVPAAASSLHLTDIDLPGTPMSGIHPRTGKLKHDDLPLSGVVHMGLNAGTTGATIKTLEGGLRLDAGTVGAAMNTLEGGLASAGATAATSVQLVCAAARAMGVQGLEQMQQLVQTKIRAAAEEAGIASFLQEGLDMNSQRDVLRNGLLVNITQRLEKLGFGQFGTLLQRLSLPDIVSSVRALAMSSIPALTETAVNSAMVLLEKLPKPSQLTSLTDNDIWELLRSPALRSSLGDILPAPLLALLPAQGAPMSSSTSATLEAVRVLLPIARQVALSKLDTRLQKLVSLLDLLHFLQGGKTSTDIDRHVFIQLLTTAGYPEALTAVMPKAVTQMLPSLEMVEQMPSKALDDLLQSLGESLGPALATTQRLTHEATAFLESQDIRKVEIPADLVMKLATINSVGITEVSPKDLYDVAFRLQGVMANDQIQIPSIRELTADPQKKEALMASLRISGLPQLAAKLSCSLPANLQLNLARLNAANIDDMPTMELQWILQQIGYPEVFQQRGGELVPSLDEVLANRSLLKKPLSQYKLTGTIGLESLAMLKMESALSQLSEFTNNPVFDLFQVHSLIDSAASMLPNGLAVSGAHVADLGSNVLQIMHSILDASPETARLDKVMQSMATQLKTMRQSGREDLDDINTWLSFLQQNLSIEHLEIAAVKIQSMVRGVLAREKFRSFKSFKEVNKISQATTSNTCTKAMESAESEEPHIRSHASLSAG